MTGLKSGSGDDLWGDGDDDASDEPGASEPSNDGTGGESSADRSVDAGRSPATADSDDEDDGPTPETTRDESRSTDPSTATDSATEDRPYVIRRAIQDKSVQFEREERLTFFVHDDVAEGERDLLTDVETALGRDVPKFDVREAVYRAALRNRDDVLEELVRMGYTLDE